GKGCGGTAGGFRVPGGGGEPQCLTADLDRSCPLPGSRPRWSPDGASIAFAAEDQGDLGVFRVAAEGGAPPTRVIGGERVVGGFSASADGRRIAFAASDPATPAEGFAAAPHWRGGRRLTDLNRDWRGHGPP